MVPPVQGGARNERKSIANYLITGGAGFIGRHLIRELETAGHGVRVLDCLVEQVHGQGPVAPLPPSVEFIEGDARDPLVVARAVAGVDGVFHLAAEVGVGQSMYEVARYVGGNDLGTAVLMEAGVEVWITETGYSTWRHDEAEQARRFLDALDAPAERLCWYGLSDLHPDIAIQEGRQFDIRHYFMGLRDVRGREKLLARLLREGGPDAVRRKVNLTRARPARTADPVLITGGAGFIGSNLADALLSEGREVIVFDNFSRAGVSANLDWLSDRHGSRVLAQAADIRDRDAVGDAVADASAVYHLAAQVAVTDSLACPVEDFEVNARGTLNLLEALRAKGGQTPLVFASTNKVYGPLAQVATIEVPKGHLPVEEGLRLNGIGEQTPLDLSTPYGCSKGAADQYVLDYAYLFGLPAAVLRMSCIYGPRQFGTEDQGWVAHFMIRALEGEPITVFGDGAQVRDVLHVRDAVRAYRLVMADIGRLSGQAFNLGGGPENAVSLRTMLGAIERMTGRRIDRRHEAVRTGDQPYFVADTRKLQAAMGWRATMPWREGVADLMGWLKATRLPAPRLDLVLDTTGEGGANARRAGQSALGV